MEFFFGWENAAEEEVRTDSPVQEKETLDLFSDLINVREFLEIAGQIPYFNGNFPPPRNKMAASDTDVLARVLGDDKSALMFCSSTMSPASLLSGDEEVDPDMENLQKGADLSSIAKLPASKRLGFRIIRGVPDAVDFVPAAPPEDPIIKLPRIDEVISHPSVGLVVSFFRPRHYSWGTRLPHSQDVISQFAVLGQNTILDLRKRLKCVTDDSIRGDFSENPDARYECTETAGLLFPDYFIFIEDTFYYEMPKGSYSYVDEIRDWAKKHNIGDYKVAEISTTKFIDLNIRLGKPYLLSHCGDCKHVLMFNDIRLIDSQRDSFLTKDYPLALSRNNRETVSNCQLCNKNIPHWVITKHQYTPSTHMFLCDPCLRISNYNVNGSKQFDFTLQHYKDWCLV